MNTFANERTREFIRRHNLNNGIATVALTRAHSDINMRAFLITDRDLLKVLEREPTTDGSRFVHDVFRMHYSKAALEAIASNGKAALRWGIRQE